MRADPDQAFFAGPGRCEAGIYPFRCDMTGLCLWRLNARGFSPRIFPKPIGAASATHATKFPRGNARGAARLICRMRAAASVVRLDTVRHTRVSGAGHAAHEGPVRRAVDAIGGDARAERQRSQALPQSIQEFAPSSQLAQPMIKEKQ